MSDSISIVDYGMGNSGSILNMLKRIGAAAKIVSTPEEIAAADKLILPGVGAFDSGMDHLNRARLKVVLDEKVLDQKTPILGVCLGMQLLGLGSEEGGAEGLRWIAARSVKFQNADDKTLKIPHMGWNITHPANDSAMFAGFSKPPRFYFVHSYHVVCDDPADVAATVAHGQSVTAAVKRGHIHGVQFHPEKSHKFGMEILRYFAALPC